jgi:hypothetical protein
MSAYQIPKLPLQGEIEIRAGFCKLPETELKNERTGKTVYTPLQSLDSNRSVIS